jgi:aminoglycoside phosphotransferase (APT) family kinase protein
MAAQAAPPTDDEPTDDDKLRACIERLVGGRVISMTRQIRWRPAWFADVQRGNEVVRVHVRGDRKSDILPFPELKREADILEVLEQHGIPVPHIYGMCDDPLGIVMEAVPGTRDVSKAASDAERSSISKQFIEAVAHMHRLPVDPFVARGIRLPQGPQEIALAGLTAYWPLYAKSKVRPEPLIEFAVRWLRTHVPMHRTRPSFIQFDSGQFLFENGQLQSLYDFEFAMIGEPLTDLATMRMRHSYEHLGEEFRQICRNYALASGEPLDVFALRYQNVLFSTVSCMQIAGVVAAPKAGDPHDTYLEWDLALRRVLVIILAECMGVGLEQPQPGKARPAASTLAMLKDAVEQIGPADEMAAARKKSALNIVEFLRCQDEMGDWLNETARSEAVPFLGKEAAAAPDLDAQLERFVMSAGPELDEPLLRYFAAQVERRVMVFGKTTIGRSAQNVHLPPIV